MSELMQPESNPLRIEFAKAQRPAQHPDADQLAAFAEGTLLQRERVQVLEHLACCQECRDVVSLSTAASPELPSTMPAVRRISSGRVWLPRFAIAGLALTVATSVMLISKHRQSSVSPTPTDKVARLERPAQPPAPVRAEANAAAAPAPKPERHRKPFQDEMTAGRLETKPVAPIAGAGLLQNMQSVALAQPTAASQQVGREATQQASALGYQQKPLTTVGAFAASPPPPPQTTTAEVAPLIDYHGALAKKSARAAAAPAALAPEGFGGATATDGLISRPHWRIDPQGHAERQTGSGAWQAVLPQESARMRVVAVYGDAVWLGGEGQHLYRSIDNGNTWTAVVLPSKGSGTHTIAHIRFSGTLSGTVEADDGTLWTTADGGATWN